VQELIEAPTALSSARDTLLAARQRRNTPLAAVALESSSRPLADLVAAAADDLVKAAQCPDTSTLDNVVAGCDAAMASYQQQLADVAAQAAIDIPAQGHAELTPDVFPQALQVACRGRDGARAALSAAQAKLSEPSLQQHAADLRTSVALYNTIIDRLNRLPPDCVVWDAPAGADPSAEIAAALALLRSWQSDMASIPRSLVAATEAAALAADAALHPLLSSPASTSSTVDDSLISNLLAAAEAELSWQPPVAEFPHQALSRAATLALGASIEHRRTLEVLLARVENHLSVYAALPPTSTDSLVVAQAFLTARDKLEDAREDHNVILARSSNPRRNVP